MSGELLYSGYGDPYVFNKLEIYTDQHLLLPYSHDFIECNGPVIVFKDYVIWQVVNKRTMNYVSFHIFHKKTASNRFIMFDNAPTTFKAYDREVYIHSHTQGFYLVSVLEQQREMMIKKIDALSDITEFDGGKIIYPKNIGNIFNGFRGLGDMTIVFTE